MMRRAARKAAGVFFVIALVLLLASVYVALVYHGDVDVGADLVASVAFGTWIAAFAVCLAVIFLILLILFITRTDVPVAEAPRSGNEVTITCRDCKKDYIITDTGERPLLHACPHCGFTDQYPPSEEPVVDAQPDVAFTTPVPAVTAMDGAPESLVIHCTHCGTNFETPYTEERPLMTNCANCGKKGVLRANAPTHPADAGSSPA